VARIGILNLGLHGHLRPASRLGRVLAARGHEVVAWAPEAVRDVVAQGGVELRPAGEIIETEPLHDVAFGAALAAYRTPPLVEPLIEQLHAEHLDLVVYDCMLPAARVAAEWLGLPRVCSVPQFPPGLRARDAEAPPAQPPPMELVEVLLESRDEVGTRWGVDLGLFREVLQNPGDLNVVYTTAEIVGTEPPDDTWRWVGPLLEPLPPADRGADDATPLVFVTLGTTFSNAPEVFGVVLEGLADAGVRVLAGTGGRLDPAALEPTPPNARVERWPDAREALRDARVAVVHGGIGIVHETLAAGVPMVCVPQGADQWGWARRVAELGVGVELDSSPAPGEVRDAVLHLLEAAPPRRRAAALAGHLASYPGESIAAGAIEALLEEG
jgi:MGT family glycosyltransferase